MSRLTDYSKFDHLTEDSDEESHHNDKDGGEKSNHKAQEATAKVPSGAPEIQSSNDANEDAGGVIRRDEFSGRYRFEYNGIPVYEFEQSLDDVTIYVLPPPHVMKGNQINCIISANHFKLGLVGHSEWFLSEGTYGTVDVDESTWTLEDYDGDDSGAAKNNKTDRRKIIVIVLTKANRGKMWEAALKGTNKTKSATTSTIMDPLGKEQVRKELMIQRFQEENPGFDFSGADFNGSIPEARDFMGGIKY